MFNEGAKLVTLRLESSGTGQVLNPAPGAPAPIAGEVAIHVTGHAGPLTDDVLILRFDGLQQVTHTAFDRTFEGVYSFTGLEMSPSGRKSKKRKQVEEQEDEADDNRVAEAQEEVNQANIKIQELEGQLAELQSQAANASGSATTLSAELAEANKRIQELETEIGNNIADPSKNTSAVLQGEQSDIATDPTSKPVAETGDVTDSTTASKPRVTRSK